MEPLVYRLDQLDGFAFEEVVAQVFRRLGYAVENTQGTSDQGRDLVIRKGTEIAVVECKHQKGSVGRPVLQKLHSAAATYAGAAKAFLVTSGSIATTVHQYAREVNSSSHIQIELWDFRELSTRARSVSVFLAGPQQGTATVYSPGWSTPDQARDEFWRQHLGPLQLAPRPLNSSVNLPMPTTQLVPAVSVSYSVDRTFRSATYVLHQARAEGLLVVPINPAAATDEELKFWAGCRFGQTVERAPDGKPVESLFGIDLQTYQEKVAAVVAGRLSRNVVYTGRNNRTYSAYCEVKPSDVLTAAKPVIVARHKVEFALGPRTYGLSVADGGPAGRRITAGAGFEYGIQPIVTGRGLVCNDCGTVAPSEGPAAGVRCASCQKTLCSKHQWKWPGRLGHQKPRLCADCYRRRDPAADSLAAPRALRSLGGAILLALVPGVSLLIGRRILAGLLLLAATAAVAGLVALRFPLPVFDLALSPRALLPLVGISALITVPWSFRIRRYNVDMRVLASYRAPW